jgi:hypothetical protein
MTASPQALERRLVQAYREQLRHYDRALAIVEQEPPPANPTMTGQWALDLDAVLRNVGALDAALAEDKAAWRLSGQQPGPELSALLDQLANRLGMLAQIVKGQVAEFEARREQLLPEMDAFIQQRRMLSAYGTYGDRHTHDVKPS